MRNNKTVATIIVLLLAISSMSATFHISTTNALPPPPVPGPSLIVDDTINRVNATLGIMAGSQVTAKGTLKNIGTTTLTNLLTGVFFIEGPGVLVPADFSFEFSFDCVTWFPIHPSEVKVPTPAAAPMQVELPIGSPGGETFAPNATSTMYLRMTLHNNLTPIQWPTNIIQSMIVWVYGDTNLNRQYDGGETIYSQPPAYGGLIDWDNPMKIDLAIVHTAEIAGTGKFYYSIQAAINAANPGDTIWVYPGTYNEAVNVNKAVKVIGSGASTAFIDGTGLALGSAGLVKITAPGDATFSGFTVENAPPAGGVTIGILSQGAVDGVTYTISYNNIYGTNDSSNTDDYGFYSQTDSANVIFTHNLITQTGANNIVFELHTGTTEISYNTLEAGIGLAADAVFFMTYNAIDVTTLQNVSGNTINMGTGTVFDYAHRSTGISFNTPGAAWGLADAKFTNVVIQGNTINNLKSNRRGIGFWNGGGGGGGAIAPVIKGNTITGAAGATASYGIDFIGAGSTQNAMVTNNKISATDWGIYLRTADCAPGTQIHYNNIVSNNNGLDNAVGLSDVDARFNWWGATTGPFHSVTNPSGTGNNVTDNVDYSPWLGKTIGNTPMTYHVNPTGTIQEAIDAASSGDTIVVHSGTYNEALYITKSLTITTASMPVITGSQMFATNYGNRQAVIFVKDAANVVLNGLDIEGLGLGVPPGTKNYAVIYQNSGGTIQNCIASPNTAGDMYSTAIAAWDNSALTIQGCTIKNFGRIGVYSNHATLTIKGNTIIGQVYNDDNLVNYGIEIEDYSGPSTASITLNKVYNCNDISPSPLWSSAAIIVDTWREWADVYDLTLLPSTVSITNNVIYNNYESIEIVASDKSSAHYNNFTNNAWGVRSAAENFTTNPTYYVFDARFNWWGDASGPNHSTSWMYNGKPYGPHHGLGDKVSDYVLYDPWDGVPLPTISVTPLIEKQILGATFTVNITISNMREGWREVGVQFRLLFDGTLIQYVNATEGPFMLDPRWNLHGTVFMVTNETAPLDGPNVIVGILLVPSDSGGWQSFPDGNGTLATLTFRVVRQETGIDKPPLTSALTLIDTMIINEIDEEVPVIANNGLFKMYPTNAADINHDYIVNMWDIGIAARAFGSVPGDLNWNPIADITGPTPWVPDGIVNMRDIGYIARNFGWTPIEDP